MRNPFARLARSDTARPSLRDRAAALKASASRVIRREPKAALPEASSEEAWTLFRAACTETDRLSRDAVLGYPELKRTDLESWTCDTLQRALEEGAITPVEMAPLYQLAAEREHRIRAAAVATNVGALHVLAFADDFTRAAAMTAAETEADPILAAIAETRRLTTAAHHASDLPVPAGTTKPLPEQNAVHAAFRTHVDDVLLETVPTTAAGCAALARYAGEFLENEGFALDEDANNNHHVRILDLIARSPLLDGAPSARPPVPDFSDSSAIELMRTYNALKMATDIFGLTGWTVSREDIGLNLLDEEGDRLSFFQDYIADELKRRDLPDRTHAGHRADTVINRAVACGDYEEAAHFAAEAAARHL